VKAESFAVEREDEAEVMAVMPPVAEGGGGGRGKGRGGMNPAFSSSKTGVFGLRRPRG
jgi:poly(A) polymerase